MTELPRIAPTPPVPAIRPLKPGRQTSRDPRKRRDDEPPAKGDDSEDEPTPEPSPAPHADGTDPETDAPRINIRV